jgi:hypothetical protein
MFTACDDSKTVVAWLRMVRNTFQGEGTFLEFQNSEHGRFATNALLPLQRQRTLANSDPAARSIRSSPSHWSNSSVFTISRIDKDNSDASYSQPRAALKMCSLACWCA